uniref:Uncharacterized protein n=1 Tax=Setaria italica TaxID=4555 RepID=K4ANX3_SETIT
MKNKRKSAPRNLASDRPSHVYVGDYFSLLYHLYLKVHVFK